MNGTVMTPVATEFTVWGETHWTQLISQTSRSLTF